MKWEGEKYPGLSLTPTFQPSNSATVPTGSQLRTWEMLPVGFGFLQHREQRKRMPQSKATEGKQAQDPHGTELHHHVTILNPEKSQSYNLPWCSASSLPRDWTAPSLGVVLIDKAVSRLLSIMLPINAFFWRLRGEIFLLFLVSNLFLHPLSNQVDLGYGHWAVKLLQLATWPRQWKLHCGSASGLPKLLIVFPLYSEF